MRLLRISAIIVVLLVIFGCSTAESAEITLGNQFDAITTCVHHRPITILREYPDSTYGKAVRAHEAVHRRQMARHCDEVQARYKSDLSLRLLLEIEAYCAGLETANYFGRPVAVSIDTLRARMRRVYGVKDSVNAAVIDAGALLWCRS